jgi:hypothetical protein
MTEETINDCNIFHNLWLQRPPSKANTKLTTTKRQTSDAYTPRTAVQAKENAPSIYPCRAVPSNEWALEGSTTVQIVAVDFKRRR